MNRSNLDIKSTISVLLATVVAASCCNAAIAQGQLKLVSVKPTVFFVREDNILTQIGEATISNSSQEKVQIALQTRIPGKRMKEISATVPKGTTTVKFPFPDITEPKPVTFILRVNGKEHDRHSMTWQPQRKWHVYFVPITHHDLGYTDTIENVLLKYDGFYDDILRFCHETDDWPDEARYRYTAESAWSMQHFVENRPEESIAQLAKYVKQGRIEIGALFGVEISALCSHEELVRLMYPSFRMARQFDGQILTGGITDVPGLSWGLPTVMAGAGVKYLFAGLPTYFEWGGNDVHTFWDESAILRHGRPDAFRWQGPDGETVLVYYQGSYGFFTGAAGPNSYKEVMDNLPGKLDRMDKQGIPFDVVRYTHKSLDNIPPDINISHIVREWNSRWAYPKLIVATNSMFFEELEKQCQDVRTFKGELPHTDYVVGAISSAKQTSINRITHDRLHSAEKFATIASLVSDYAYPAEKIREAYDNVLLYDEHTWGMAHQAGKVQDWDWSDKSHYAYKAAGIAETILSYGQRYKSWRHTGSLNEITDEIELKEKGRHIVVFNSLSFQRTDVVKVPSVQTWCVSVPPAFFVEQPFDLIDEETGQKVPYQIVELYGPQAPVPYSAQRYARGQFARRELFELVFAAEDVPSLGYKTYRLAPKEEVASFSSSVVVGENSLENRFFRVTLDPQAGTVESIYDKQLSREIVDKGASHKLNQFVARWVQSGKEESPKQAKIRKGQSGPVCGSLVVTSEGVGCPQITQEIILYDKVKRIDFANRVLKDSTPLLEIYFAFPFKMNNPDFRFEGSNSVIKPFRDQFPGSNTNYYTVQHWADVSDGNIGITLSPIESHLLEFGGLWPCYVSQAHHGVTPPDFGREFLKPSELTKGHMYSFVLNSNFSTNFHPIQQGDMLFRYSITTHEGGWKEGRCRNFGWSTGNPLIPMAVNVNGRKEGTLDKRMSFCRVDKPNVLLLTLKRAEDGDGIIIRLIETQGKATTASVTLPHIAVAEAMVTNLVEENKGRATFTEHEIQVNLKAFGITTIRIKTD